MPGLFVPALLGTTILAAFMLGGEKQAEASVKEELDSLDETQKASVAEAAKAAKAKEWQKAVAAAIKSGSTKLMRELAGELKKAGLKEEAAELVKLAERLEKAKKEKKPTKAPTLAKPTTKAPTLAKPKVSDLNAAKKAASEAAKKKAAEAAAKKAADAAKKKAAEAAAKKAAEDKKKKAADAEKAKLTQQAVELKEHLVSTGRYKENQEYVKRYQANNKVVPADGKYGPATARTFWSKYKLVPVNPFYWSSSTANKDTAAYRAFLDTIAADSPKHAAEVTKLKATVGR